MITYTSDSNFLVDFEVEKSPNWKPGTIVYVMESQKCYILTRDKNFVQINPSMRNMIELDKDVQYNNSTASVFTDAGNLQFLATKVGKLYKVHATLLFVTAGGGVLIGYNASPIIQSAQFVHTPVTIAGSLSTVDFAQSALNPDTGVSSATSISSGTLITADFVFKPNQQPIIWKLRFASATAGFGIITLKAGSTIEWW